MSEAMMLGSTTCKMEAANINSCTLGAAMNALGVPEHSKRTVKIYSLGLRLTTGFDRYEALLEQWPWTYDPAPSVSLAWGSTLARTYGSIIAWLFDNSVVEGRMTLEQLADWVHDIEPECGECCAFDCACAAVDVLDEGAEEEALYAVAA